MHQNVFHQVLVKIFLHTMRKSSLLQEYSSKVIYQSMDFVYENVV